MAQRLIYDASDGIFGENSSISTGNWPKTVVNGGNSGATEVNAETGSPNDGTVHAGTNSRAPTGNSEQSLAPHDLKGASLVNGGSGNGGSGGNGQYGEVGLYWWQEVGVLNE